MSKQTAFQKWYNKNFPDLLTEKELELAEAAFKGGRIDGLKCISKKTTLTNCGIIVYWDKIRAEIKKMESKK